MIKLDCMKLNDFSKKKTFVIAFTNIVGPKCLHLVEVILALHLCLSNREMKRDAKYGIVV